jgi:hypothetical protein
MPGIAFGNDPVQISSSYVYWPPTIDGVVGWGAWNMPNRIDYDWGFITVHHDDIRLYILVDVLADTTDDPLSYSPDFLRLTGDYFWLTFDADRDGLITPGDLKYELNPSTHNMFYRYHVAPARGWGGSPGFIRSSVAAGFGCFRGDGTHIPFTFPLAPVCNKHRVWEFGIDLREIGAAPGDTVRMGLRIVSENPSFTYDIPANFTQDFSDLIEVELPTPEGWSPPPNLEASIGFNERDEHDAIEVTQAIQDRDNSLPLVEDKRTVARVYVEANGGVDTSQPVVVYLYGTRDGTNLQGSPLSMLFMAPPYRTHGDYPPSVPPRNELDSTANFLLPRSWTTGTVQFQGRVVDYSSGNEVAASTPFFLSFTPKYVPVYWLVPINIGTDDDPELVNPYDISRQADYLKTVYPVPDVEFVRKSWTEIGVTSRECVTVIEKLNDYYDSVLAAEYLGWPWGEEPIVALPDQIYGFLPRVLLGCGMGTSDPVWLGGRGRVAAGFGGSLTSADSKMAHEINHNLDRRSREEATWGRHVGNLDDDTWGIDNENRDLNWGCGASGPHDEWPSEGDDEIGEVGFDTRRPWGDPRGNRETVIDKSCPDFMSYCTWKEKDPAQWISPYRWEHLFNDAFSARPGYGVPRPLFWVSGHIDVNGTGSLDPVFGLPGIPMRDIAPGDYVIEVQDASGTSLLKTPFFASFTDVEGNKVETVYFHFQLPAQEGTSRILLKRGEQTLDKLQVSENPPQVTVVAPKEGEQWSGLQTIEWSARDEDGDPLHFAIFYSPDKGESWHPVAWNLEGEAYKVDTSFLPGGEAAKIRVIATDGFNTTQDDSKGTFTVNGKPPTAFIIRPEAETQFSPGEPISFEGEATDLEDGSIPDASFTWSYDSTVFATGRRVNARLPEGIHEVALTVLDSEGNTGQDRVVIPVRIPDSEVTKTTCSTLGNDPEPSILDQDIFNFQGIEGEKTTIRLEAEPPEAGSGKRAALILEDNECMVRLYEIDQSVLPNAISVTLPATCEYRITVTEQQEIEDKEYKGDYCLTLEASPETCETLEATYLVE